MPNQNGFTFLSIILIQDQIQHEKFFSWKLKMLDLIHVFCRLKNSVDGKRFHVHYLLNIFGNCPVPKLFGGGIDPDQVWEMLMKSFQIFKAWYGRFFSKLNWTIWRQQFVWPHIWIPDNENSVVGTVFHHFSQRYRFAPCLIFIYPVSYTHLTLPTKA